MKVVTRAAVLGLAGVSAFGVAGCNRGGGGGTTTVIQQPGGGGATSSSSVTSSSVASVAPIDDPKELCHQVLLKTRGLSNAVGAFWKIATSRHGWADNDPDVSDAVSPVDKEYGQVFPALNGIVGQGVPADTAEAVNDYLKKLQVFSDAITEQQKDEVLNPAASSFGTAKNKLEAVCNAAG